MKQGWCITPTFILQGCYSVWLASSLYDLLTNTVVLNKFLILTFACTLFCWLRLDPSELSYYLISQNGRAWKILSIFDMSWCSAYIPPFSSVSKAGVCRYLWIFVVCKLGNNLLLLKNEHHISALGIFLVVSDSSPAIRMKPTLPLIAPRPLDQLEIHEIKITLSKLLESDELKPSRDFCPLPPPPQYIAFYAASVCSIY